MLKRTGLVSIVVIAIFTGWLSTAVLTNAQPTRQPITPTTLGLYQEAFREGEIVRFAERPVVIKTITVHEGSIALEDGAEGMAERSFRFAAGTLDGRRRQIPHTYPLDVRFQGSVILRCVEGPTRITITFESP